MVFKATFNNISVISWRSVLLVEEIGVRGESNQPATIRSLATCYFDNEKLIDKEIFQIRKRKLCIIYH